MNDDPELNPARFNTLLDLAGPETAGALLTQILHDLNEIRTALRQAAPAGDFAVIRARTHVLSALAGELGADTLHGLAVDLNRAAHAEVSADTAALWARAQPRLDALIACVAAEADARGAGA